jgi:hypothetical protein
MIAPHCRLHVWHGIQLATNGMVAADAALQR